MPESAERATAVAAAPRAGQPRAAASAAAPQRAAKGANVSTLRTPMSIYWIMAAAKRSRGGRVKASLQPAERPGERMKQTSRTAAMAMKGGGYLSTNASGK